MRCTLGKGKDIGGDMSAIGMIVMIQILLAAGGMLAVACYGLWLWLDRMDD